MRLRLADVEEAPTAVELDARRRVAFGCGAQPEDRRSPGCDAHQALVYPDRERGRRTRPGTGKLRMIIRACARFFPLQYLERPGGPPIMGVDDWSSVRFCAHQ